MIPAMTFVRSFAIVLTALFAGFLGCEDQGDASTNSSIPGAEPSTYTYRAYTSAGVLAVSGTITMARTDSTRIAGTWSLVGVSSTDSVGPQLGAGTLAGQIADSKLSIDLNPGWRDNNVILSGSMVAEKIAGSWMWITFAGPRTSGTFEAVRKK